MVACQSRQASRAAASDLAPSTCCPLPAYAAVDKPRGARCLAAPARTLACDPWQDDADGPGLASSPHFRRKLIQASNSCQPRGYLFSEVRGPSEHPVFPSHRFAVERTEHAQEACGWRANASIAPMHDPCALDPSGSAFPRCSWMCASNGQVATRQRDGPSRILTDALPGETASREVDLRHAASSEGDDVGDDP
jgi:hypothetical protein